MIKLCRVDHRLIHGQVAFSWTKYLSVDCILVASDKVAKDQLKMNMLKMAKPDGVKLVMKSIDDSIAALNSGVTDKYSLLILCDAVDEAYRLLSGAKSITSLNLGGMKHEEGMITLSKAVNVTESDIELLNKLSASGVEVYAQLVPDSQKLEYKALKESKC